MENEKINNQNNINTQKISEFTHINISFDNYEFEEKIINSMVNKKVNYRKSIKANKLKGGQKFKRPEPKIQLRSVDYRISMKESATNLASQQIRHFRRCNEQDCKYQWCKPIKKLYQHYKSCPNAKTSNLCYDCGTFKVLLYRSKGIFLATPKKNNLKNSVSTGVINVEKNDEISDNVNNQENRNQVINA